MRTRGEVMTSGPRGPMTVEAGGGDWPQRLYRWLGSMALHHRPIEQINQFGTWDARREEFKLLRAEAAADLLAERHGATIRCRLSSRLWY